MLLFSLLLVLIVLKVIVHNKCVRSAVKLFEMLYPYLCLFLLDMKWRIVFVVKLYSGGEYLIELSVSWVNFLQNEENGWENFSSLLILIELFFSFLSSFLVNFELFKWGATAQTLLTSSAGDPWYANYAFALIDYVK